MASNYLRNGALCACIFGEEKIRWLATRGLESIVARQHWWLPREDDSTVRQLVCGGHGMDAGVVRLRVLKVISVDVTVVEPILIEDSALMATMMN